jgi:prepilin-type N-terminal cleavage/methylation domain-containing protein
MRSVSKNSRGFTLIELLVVISIISLLSSVVLASLQSARIKGRTAAGIEFEHSALSGAYNEKLAEYDFSTANVTCSSGNIITPVLDVGGNSAANLTVYSGPACSSLGTSVPVGNGRSAPVTIALNSGTIIPPGGTVSGISLSTWLQCTNSGTNVGNLTVAITTPNSDSFMIGSDGTNLFTKHKSTTNNTVPIGQICDGNWHQILASFDSNTSKLYIDGALSSSIAATAAVSVSSVITTFGISAPTYYLYHPMFFGTSF